MADPSAGRDTAESDVDSSTGTPRWVRVFGIVALVVVVLFLILLFTRGLGAHGPGRHTGGMGAATSQAGPTAGLPR